MLMVVRSGARTTLRWEKCKAAYLVVIEDAGDGIRDQLDWFH